MEVPQLRQGPDAKTKVSLEPIQFFFALDFPPFQSLAQNDTPERLTLIVDSRRKETLMSTLNKAESSRINGAKSRGPITPEGKQRSSLNSVRHGLLAKVHCLTNENQGLFKELLQDYLTR